MCLDSLWTKEKTKKWLKNKPDTIVAWKVALIKHGHKKLFAPMFSHYQYHRYNNTKYDEWQSATVADNRDGVEFGEPRYSENYKLRYHLFVRREDARIWKADAHAAVCESFKVIKCEIPKSSIETIGWQFGAVVVVSKEFTITGEDIYFKEKNHANS